jgi:hypothetical protein
MLPTEPTNIGRLPRVPGQKTKARMQYAARTLPFGTSCANCIRDTYPCQPQTANCLLADSETGIMAYQMVSKPGFLP